MRTTTVAPQPASQPFTETAPPDTSGIGGHPKGLTTLFFTEMWERFSYYGMRALLVLYMVAPQSAGGLELDTVKATSIYGAYTSAVYFTNIFGGLLADRLLGARLAVLLGGIIIAAGHFSMAFHSPTLFYCGLLFIVIGTGLLKPNISAMVGKLYSADDPRRDSGFSIFYMGINLGAMIAPLICGYIGQRIDWHLGFATAGVGMCLGILQYVANRKHLAHVGGRPPKMVNQPTVNRETNKPKLTTTEKRHLVIVCMLYFFSIIFWMAFEQSGSSFALFGQNQTRTSLFGFEFPSSWFQSVNSIFILALAPVFSWIWIRWGKRQPSSAAKFSVGLLFTGIGMLVMAAAALFTASGKVSPLWLIGVFFIHTIGELCLSPVGLSTVTKLSPVRMVGMMMGFWFLATSLGNYLAGWAAGFYQDDSGALFRLFGSLGLATLAGAALLALLLPFIRKLTAQSEG